MTIKGLGLTPESFTASGMAQVDAVVIKQLAGKDPSKGEYGTAYDYYKSLEEEQMGIDMCLALESWLKFKGIEKLLSTYINPL